MPSDVMRHLIGEMGLGTGLGPESSGVSTLTPEQERVLRDEMDRLAIEKRLLKRLPYYPGSHNPPPPEPPPSQELPPTLDQLHDPDWLRKRLDEINDNGIPNFMPENMTQPNPPSREEILKSLMKKIMENPTASRQPGVY